MLVTQAGLNTAQTPTSSIPLWPEEGYFSSGRPSATFIRQKALWYHSNGHMFMAGAYQQLFHPNLVGVPATRCVSCRRATPSPHHPPHCSYVTVCVVLSRITAAKGAIRGACAVWCCLVTAVVLSLLVPVHSLLTTHTRRCLKSFTAARSLVVRMSVSVSSLPRMEGELFCFHQGTHSTRL
jgi:hypothetical protein